MDVYVRFKHKLSPSFSEEKKIHPTNNFSVDCMISMYRRACSVPFFISTSVGNYTQRNGTEQNDIRCLPGKDQIH